MPTPWAAILGSAGGVLGTVTFIQFLWEEAMQTAQMGMWVLIDNEAWEAAEDLFDTLHDMKNGLREINDTIGWLNPHTKGAFEVYVKATEAQLAAYQVILNKYLVKTPDLGTLRITSTPSSAAIYLNDMEMELMTPETFRRLTPGEYGIKLRRFNPRTGEYVTKEETVIVEAAKKKEVHIVLWYVPAAEPVILPPEKRPGKIYLKTTPSRALIYVDGIDQEKLTPETLKLDPGTHKIRVRKYNTRTEEWVEKTETLEIKPDVEKELRITLWEPPAKPERLPTEERPAKLRIYSIPSHADIYLDGYPTGWITPETLELYPDKTYTVKLRWYDVREQKWYEASERYTLEPDEKKEVRIIIRERPKIIVEPAHLPGKSHLSIASTPSDAEIILNGIDTEKLTPETFLNLEPGAHTVTLRRLNLRTEEWVKATEIYTLKPDEKQEHKIILWITEKVEKVPIRIPGMSELRILSTPTEAEITLDGTPTGLLTPETFLNLEPGTHTITLRRFNPRTDEWVEIEETVTLYPDEKLEIEPIIYT